MKQQNESAESIWTAERIELLRSLWARGLSAAQIATKLGAGISRNAVLGKRLRLKLGRRRSPAARVKNKPRRQHKFKSAPVYPPLPLPDQAAVAVEPLHIAFADLEPSHCRWPYGDGPFTFCGHPSTGDHPYCTHHQPVATRKRGAGHEGGFQFMPIRKRPIREAA